MKKRTSNRLQKSTARKSPAFEVYFLGPSGKHILVARYNDAAPAREHLAELRRLYGKDVQAGIDEKLVSSKVRMSATMKKARDILKKVGR